MKNLNLLLIAITLLVPQFSAKASTSPVGECRKEAGAAAAKKDIILDTDCPHFDLGKPGIEK